MSNLAHKLKEGQEIRVRKPIDRRAWIQKVGKDHVSIYLEHVGMLYAVPKEKIAGEGEDPEVRSEAAPLP